MRSIHRKTGPKPRFERDDVIEAALRLGLDRFTLGDIAVQLGVSTSTLYRTIRSRDDIIEAALTRVADELHAPDPEADPQTMLTSLATDLWTKMDTYLGLNRVFVSFPPSVQIMNTVSVPVFNHLATHGIANPMRVVTLTWDCVVASHLRATLLNPEWHGVHNDVDITGPITPAPADTTERDDRLAFVIPALIAADKTAHTTAGS